jgi:hypothetical protein
MQSRVSKFEHYRAFSQDFFLRHQRTLLWLLNARLTRLWFRWVLRIHRDCPRDSRIIEIYPHAFVRLAGYAKVEGHWQQQRIADFRTHPKFAKRLYHAFKPLWWLMHVWDMVADPLIPSLSFGFSTLTVNPNADPESTTIDGQVQQTYSAGSGQSWATIRNAAGSGFRDNVSPENIIYIASDSGSNNWKIMERSIFLFDTSALTSAASVSAATFSIFGNGKTDPQGWTPNVNLYASTPASNTGLANGDFAQIGSTAYCNTPISYSGFSTSAYNDFALNSTGIAAVSLTSITKLGLRNANYDVANVSPTWAASMDSQIDCLFAENTGTASDPKLVITYNVSITVSITAQSSAFSLQSLTVRTGTTASPNVQSATFSIASPTVTTQMNTLYENKYTARGTSHNSKYTIRGTT